MNSRLQRDKEYLKREYRTHKGEWLTIEAVTEFQRLADKLQDVSGQISGEKRKLCMRLVKEYGVTELEAVNIINGNHVMDYVAKYERIRNQVPLYIKNDKAQKEEEE
ncbi:MAG: hypothetical protein IJX63_14225 [Lachnospiraceae bacterium]|nr:hypothetical protein [Lachnospiraceae bacterium]